MPQGMAVLSNNGLGGGIQVVGIKGLGTSFNLLQVNTNQENKIKVFRARFFLKLFSRHSSILDKLKLALKIPGYISEVC